MRHVPVACGLLLAFALAFGGCGRLEYRSIIPSAQSFHEDPSIDDMYVGAQAEFVVTDRAQQRYMITAALPRHADTLDAWNPSIAWDQITTPPIQTGQASTGAEPQAETDAAPVFEDWGTLGL